LRFVLEADDSTPIQPGEAVARSQVELTDNDIAFSETRVFQTGDQFCGGDAVECTSVFACGNGNPNFETSFQRCLGDGNLFTDGPLQFDSDTTKPQLFGVMMDNGGSLEGWLPTAVGERSFDFDGDGVAESRSSNGPEGERATDRNRIRFVGLSNLRSTWEIAATNAVPRRTYFGLWLFSGTSTANVTSPVAEVSPNGQEWIADRKLAESAASEASRIQVSGTRSNVFQAAASVLEGAYADEQYKDHEKTMVLFVDGPDDLRLPNWSAQRVIDAATSQGVRIFIVHLDANTGLGRPDDPLYRDDPRYYANQEACADESACKNFEECRIPQGYADQAGPVDMPPTETMCLPKRDNDGRFGPIDEYAQIACETEGGYLYSPSAAGIPSRMGWLPYAMDGLWQIDVKLDLVENGEIPVDTSNKLQTSFRIAVGGRDRPYDFSQKGDPSAGTEDDDTDNRTVIFSRSN
jgi:hypothetical protein